MRPLQTSPNRVIGLRRQLAACALLLSVGGLVQAQSGRRAKPQATPDQTTNTAPELSESRAEASLPRIKVFVARQSSSESLASEDQIYASFVNRLREFSVLDATSIGTLSRSQTSKRARAEANAYVVLMQFEIDSFQRGTIVLNSPDLKITYYVFAPRTGKQSTSDKLYFQAIGGARARKDNWPDGPPLRITPAAAGIAAAERLHDWLVLVTRAQTKP